MTNQHRATPEQWAKQEKWASVADSSCILELRARVEALENAQRPRPRKWQLLRTETVYTTPDVPVEGLLRNFRLAPGEWAAILAAQRSEKPADSLVERVADAIGAADDEGLTDMAWNYHARAAIREVAAWLNERDLQTQNEDDCLEAPFVDDAVRWLRNEANQ